MTTNRPAVVGGASLAKALKELFTDDQALTAAGVGSNLVGMLAELVRAIDANTEQVRRFNDRRDREDGP